MDNSVANSRLKTLAVEVRSPSPCPSSAMSTDSDADSAFAISQFHPVTIPTPLTSVVRFVRDSQCILLNPERLNPSAESPFPLDGKAPGSAQALSTEADAIDADIHIQLAGPRKRIFFQPQETTAGMVTCGGVCPGLNNVVRALVNILWYRYGVRSILGFRYGYLGLTPGQADPLVLTPENVKDVHQFGGTILGSSRGAQKAEVMVDTLIQRKVNILFCIGGDGTQRGAHTIVQEIQRRQLQISVIGIGKTIDNDLLFVDKSFGFETAVELSQNAIVAAHEEARSSFNGIGIVKLMGRDSGAIALNASLASGDVNVVLVPEVQFNFDQLIEYLVERFKTKDHCLIVTAEGAGQHLLGDSGTTDASGNKKFLDIGEHLKKEIGKRFKDLQIEHSIKYIDPSYTIRGGKANASDSIFCTLYAQMAAHAGMAGKTDMMVGMLHGQFVHLPLQKVTEGKKNVDIRGVYWQGFVDATGSPFVG